MVHLLSLLESIILKYYSDKTEVNDIPFFYNKIYCRIAFAEIIHLKGYFSFRGVSCFQPEEVTGRQFYYKVYRFIFKLKLLKVVSKRKCHVACALPIPLGILGVIFCMCM